MIQTFPLDNELLGSMPPLFLRENWDDLLTKVKAIELRLEATPPWAFGQTAGRCFFIFPAAAKFKRIPIAAPQTWATKAMATMRLEKPKNW